MTERLRTSVTGFAVRTRLVMVVLWVVFYGSFALFVPPLLDDADSVHAEVAREMLLRHDWVTLYANGIRYLEKAPLLYWSMAASFRVFGVSTAAARLPLALTVLGLALAMEAFGRRAFQSARAGLYAGVILLSSFGIFIFTRILIPDVAVCLWLTLAMLCFWRTTQQEQPGRWLCYGFAACCALNVLTKGLIGIVFPVAIVLLYLVATRGFSHRLVARLGKLYPVSSGAVFLAIAGPWHVLIGLANPTQGHPGGLQFARGHWSVPLPTDGNVHGWTWFYFVNEQVLRYLDLRVPRDYDTVPLALFWGLLVVWLLPWSAYVYQGLRAVPWRAGFRRATSTSSSSSASAGASHAALTARERTQLLLGLWAAIPMLFFSFSTRQEYYVLPAIPALVLLVAGWLEKDVAGGESRAAEPVAGEVAGEMSGRRASTGLTSQRRRSGRRSGRHGGRRAWLSGPLVLLIFGGIASAAALFFAFAGSTPGNGRSMGGVDLASVLQQHPGDYALSFGHFLDLNRAAMGAFRVPLLLTAAALLGGTLANFLLLRRGLRHRANLALAAGAFGFLLAAHLGLQIFSPVLSSRQLAAAIAPMLEPGDVIVIHGEYEAASTLGFYLRRPSAGTEPVHILEGRSSNLWYGSFFSDAPKIFETPASLAARWAGPGRVFLWQDLKGDPGPVPLLPGRVFVVATGGGKEILSNR